MVNFVSPGVYVIEKDISDYVPALNPTVVGIVGFATKGPTNKATLITSQANLVDTFGRPKESLAGQGLEGSLEILETCNQLFYVRAADTATANEASGLMQMGACPHIGVCSLGFGVTSSIYLKVQVTNNAGTNQFTTVRKFAITSGTTIGSLPATNQSEAFRAVMGGGLDSDAMGSYFTTGTGDVTLGNIGNFIAGNFAGSGATLSVSAFEDSGYTNGAEFLIPFDNSGTPSGLGFAGPGNLDNSYAKGQTGFSSIVTTGWTFLQGDDISGVSYNVESIYPGEGYNLSTLPDGSLEGNSVSLSPLGGRNFTVNVNDNGVTAESFKASLVASGAFIEDVINTGSVDLKSNFIKGNLYASGNIFNNKKLDYYQDFASSIGVDSVLHTVALSGVRGTTTMAFFDAAASTVSAKQGVTGPQGIGPRFMKLIEGTTNLVSGTNGDGAGNTTNEAAALIGVTSPSRTGMQALNEELVPLTMGLVPGITDQNVQNALLTLAETTGSFLAIFGTPIGIGNPQDANDYANGQTPYRSSPFNSSYACLYYPAVKVFQPYLAKDVWMDPAIFAARQMGYTDTVADLWFAPAGFQRGKLSKPTDVEVSINQGDRDSLYSGGNVVNPIVNFPQQGITIFGQRTTQRSPTALDRINVRRLMCYIKRVIEASTRRFIFEPNDKGTQERIHHLLVPTFADIQRRRGITDFKVICDETVNTPVRVDRNELWCKIFIKPTKSAEILVFELNITNQSANLG